MSSLTLIGDLTKYLLRLSLTCSSKTVEASITAWYVREFPQYLFGVNQSKLLSVFTIPLKVTRHKFLPGAKIKASTILGEACKPATHKSGVSSEVCVSSKTISRLSP